MPAPAPRSITDSDETVVRPAGAPSEGKARQRDLLPDDRPIGEGTLVGPYLVDRLLADGGMGRVYLVRDKVGQQLALKVLGRAACRDDALRRRFEREGEVLERLKHPNIVRQLARGADAPLGVLWLALEFIPGQDLSTLVRRCHGQQLTWSEAAYVVERCARGLAAAHSGGVIHRDMKPSNVLVSRDGTVKLTDFGVALSSADDVRLTARDHVMGTLPYMAPEILGDGEWTAKGDLYGLGCLAYKVLAARAPFIQRTFPDLVRAHREEDAPALRSLVPAVPDVLASVIHALLEKDPERRPTAEEVSRTLLAAPNLVPDEARIAAEWGAGRAGVGSYGRPATPRPGALSPAAPVSKDLRNEVTRASGRSRPWDEATQPVGKTSSSSAELMAAVVPARAPTSPAPPAPTPAPPAGVVPATAPRPARTSRRQRTVIVASPEPKPSARGRAVVIAIALVCLILTALIAWRALA